MSVRTARAPSKIYSQYAATLTPQPIKLRGHSIGVKAVLITSNRETVQFSLGQMVCQCNSEAICVRREAREGWGLDGPDPVKECNGAWLSVINSRGAVH